VLTASPFGNAYPRKQCFYLPQFLLDFYANQVAIPMGLAKAVQNPRKATVRHAQPSTRALSIAFQHSCNTGKGVLFPRRRAVEKDRSKIF
jgi:hypothetical protein